VGTRWLVVVLAGACAAEVDELPWLVEVADPGLRESWVWMDATVVPGGCGSGVDPVWAGRVVRAGGGASPPELEAGSYGFGVVLRRDNCLEYEGCVTARVPLEGELVVRVASSDGRQPCIPATACVDGDCLNVECRRFFGDEVSLCDQNETTCSVRARGESCVDLCEASGFRCVAQSPATGETCDTSGDRTPCSGARDESVCVCVAP